MKRILLLLAEFVGLSVPLTWLWLGWGRDVYFRLLLDVLVPIYRVLGIQHLRASPASPRYLSYVSFLVLMTITPGLPRRRRLLGLGGGFVLILLSHLLLTIAVDSAHTRYGEGPRATSALFPFLLGVDGFPFVLWYLLSRDFLHSLVSGQPVPARRAEDRKTS